MNPRLKAVLILCWLVGSIGGVLLSESRLPEAPPVTVYVDPELGSDANSGLSPAFPVRTMQKAGQIVAGLPPQRCTVTRRRWRGARFREIRREFARPAWTCGREPRHVEQGQRVLAARIAARVAARERENSRRNA